MSQGSYQNKSMKVVFAGTPEFARTALEALLDAGFDVPLVLTQPDRPAGRGLRVHASPVKQLALASGIAVAQPRSLRLDGKYPEDAAAAQAALRQARPDVMVVAAYGLILPQWVLALPCHGCLNIHASLLPRWRGAAPIHRAIEAGDARTGVTIMQMDAGLDTGAMLLAEAWPIAARATTVSLQRELAALGARLLVQALERIDTLRPTPQPAEGVSHARKIDKHEAAIDWSQPAEVIERRIRAFDPFPGAHTTLGDTVIKIWSSEIDSFCGTPSKPFGHVLSANEAGVRVACGRGALRLTELQRPGGKRLPAREFLAGFGLTPGQRLGAGAVR